jgi:2-phospho-L-lactate guanylyltransferase
MDVLVPVKATALAKGRLSAVLDAPGRVLLVGWMLDRVLRAATGAAVRRLFVVGGDAQTASIARRHGAGLIADRGAGLNEALSDALRQVRRPGLPACIVLAADLPWLATEDVDALVGASHGGRTAVIAPAQDGTGTNAVVAAEGYTYDPAFGPKSRARHHRLLAERGVSVIEVSRPGLAFDVDLPEHLAELATAPAFGEVEPLPSSILRQISALPLRRRA